MAPDKVITDPCLGQEDPDATTTLVPLRARRSAVRLQSTRAVNKIRCVFGRHRTGARALLRAFTGLPKAQDGSAFADHVRALPSMDGTEDPQNGVCKLEGNE